MRWLKVSLFPRAANAAAQRAAAHEAMWLLDRVTQRTWTVGPDWRSPDLTGALGDTATVLAPDDDVPALRSQVHEAVRRRWPWATVWVWSMDEHGRSTFTGDEVR